MSKYSLFSVIGLEIEYMLVDKDTLNVVPKSDVILHDLANTFVNEVILGETALSNEMTMHVLELKNNGPKKPDPKIAQQFHQTILDIQPILAKHNLILLPTGAHPWMNPKEETVRWPHGNREIYNQYDKIFNCEGHGWSNLQSMHINLPFANDQEFHILHNFIRILLPLLPALGASTPFLEGKLTGQVDSRLYFYGKNQAKVPLICGDIIPPFISSEEEYQTTILNPLYAAIHPFDPDKILQHEWLNSRAAIPKFKYNALEIRILDSQECPDADISIALAVEMLLKNWQKESDYPLKNPCDTHLLKKIYEESIYKGLNTFVDNAQLLKQWGVSETPSHLRAIWMQLLERYCSDLDSRSQQILEHILKQGNLSNRIVNACAGNYSKDNLSHVYRQLSNCLLDNQPFGLS